MVGWIPLLSKLLPLAELVFNTSSTSNKEMSSLSLSLALLSWLVLSSSFSLISLRGQGGVPWVQIMENEFECLVVRRGDGGHFAEKFVKKYCS